jgi:hypothetical protein
MEFLIFLLLLIMLPCIAVIIFINRWYEKKIREKIEDEMDGKLINYEKRSFFNGGTGPFRRTGRRSVYRVEYYNRSGQRKAIWVRFGGWFGEEWRGE